MATSITDRLEFRPDCIYTLEDVRAILGLGAAALRSARRKGLIVRRVGRRSFVLGRDLLAYVEEHGKVVA